MISMVLSLGEITVDVIFSKRKTLGLHIDHKAAVSARVPHHTPQHAITLFVTSHIHWITTKRRQILERLRLQNEAIKYISPNTVIDAKKNAYNVISERVLQISNRISLIPAKIRITSAKTRWGSCSGKNVISINWRLMLAPDDVLEYVIIHELCHIIHKNHSKQFWKEVERYDPNWKQKRAWLKAHGQYLMF